MSRTSNVLKICELLAEQEHLNATLKEGAKAAGLIGLSTFAGALLGGKTGMALGAALGGAMSWMATSEFKSVVDIIRDLTPDQKKELAENVGALFRGMQVSDAGAMMSVLAGNTSLREAVISEISTYLRSELNMNII